MYERSAIVLERYMEKILIFNKPYNLKKNSENYSELIEEIENYQKMTNKEIKVIEDFDDTVKNIENLQQQQERLYKTNKRLEDDRAQLFGDLGEEAKVLESKLKKIENALERNNEQQKHIREEFVQYLTDFSQKQKERNKCEKAKRLGEAKHIEYIEQMNIEFNGIDVKDAIKLKEFITSEKEQIKQEALDIMTRNGKSERVAFDQEALKKAISMRIDIAEKESECYISIYERMKRLLAETDCESIRLNKYKKTLRDTSVKLAFLKAETEYIVGFLDYERMTAISGTREHKKMMVEACNNFELDILQIKNLYELILKEITNKSTKKAYNELYNKTYLRNIEEKQKNFEEEANHVNISMGTVINFNYWRIEGIKNIYNVFQKEITDKFQKDLSEYRIEEPEEENSYEEYYEEKDTEEPEEENNKEEYSDKEYNVKKYKIEEYNAEEYDDQEYNAEEHDDEEYNVKEYDDEEYDAEEYDAEEYDAEEYDDEEYDVEEYDVEEYDDEEYDVEEYDDEEYDIEEYNDEEYDDEEYNVPERNEIIGYKNNNKQIQEQDKEHYEDDEYYDEHKDYKDYEDYEDSSENHKDYEQEIKEKEYARVSRYKDDDDDDDEFDNIYKYTYDEEDDVKEEYRKIQYEEEELTLEEKKKIEESFFNDEDSIDMIIEKSRKKGIKSNRQKQNKGLLNKLFKK